MQLLDSNKYRRFAWLIAFEFFNHGAKTQFSTSSASGKKILSSYLIVMFFRISLNWGQFVLVLNVACFFNCSVF